jgi:phosphoribosylformylglycinamidine synthase
MKVDGNGRWCWLDPKLGAMHAVAEAARNVACAGARPIGATNCLNFGNPEKPHIMWQFSQVIDGMTKACEELETPITGGNVSFYNETLGEGIYPTPVVGIVGLIEHLDRAITHEFRDAGRAIVLLRGSEPGDAIDAEVEFGSSEYAKEILGEVWGFPPALELGKEKALQDCILDIVGQGFADSAHDCSEGGLAVAVAESCFPRDLGARVELELSELGSEALHCEYLLFGEDASRIVVSCSRENVPRIKELAVKWGVAALPIGATQSENFEVVVDGRAVVSSPIARLKAAWKNALEHALHTETEERLVPEVLQKS